jgi:hypothetical protein
MFVVNLWSHRVGGGWVGGWVPVRQVTGARREQARLHCWLCMSGASPRFQHTCPYLLNSTHGAIVPAAPPPPPKHTQGAADRRCQWHSVPPQLRWLWCTHPTHGPPAVSTHRRPGSRYTAMFGKPPFPTHLFLVPPCPPPPPQTHTGCCR